MRKDYQIKKGMLGEKVDNESRPVRFAIATNALLIGKKNQEEKLILFNIDPKKLNKWYPCFVSHNATYDFQAETYGELIEEFVQQMDVHGFSEEVRKVASINYVEKTLKKSIGKADFVKLNIDEWWIKYSVSQKVWTIYLFENYKLIIDDMDVENSENVVSIPLTGKEQEEWMHTGIFNGIEIVDNIYALLRKGAI